MPTILDTLSTNFLTGKTLSNDDIDPFLPAFFLGKNKKYEYTTHTKNLINQTSYHFKSSLYHGAFLAPCSKRLQPFNTGPYPASYIVCVLGCHSLRLIMCYTRLQHYNPLLLCVILRYKRRVSAQTQGTVTRVPSLPPAHLQTSPRLPSS